MWKASDNMYLGTMRQMMWADFAGVSDNKVKCLSKGAVGSRDVNVVLVEHIAEATNGKWNTFQNNTMKEGVVQ